MNKIDETWRAATEALGILNHPDALAARSVIDYHHTYMDVNLRVGDIVQAMRAPACAEAAAPVAEYLNACIEEHQRRVGVHEIAARAINDIDPPPPPSTRPTWQLTPNSYTDPNGNEFTDSAPIQAVIGANTWSSSSKNRPRKCSPGDTLVLAPGEYRHFRVTHTRNANDTRMITIAGAGQGPAFDPSSSWTNGSGDKAEMGIPFIKPNPVGGSQTLYLENCHQHQFANLILEGDDSATIMTERPASIRFDGWDERPAVVDCRLRNVNVDGGWNFHQSIEANLDAGHTKTKWGLQSYELGKTTRPDRPGFAWRDSWIRGIYKEQHNYVHNPQGDCVWGNIKAYGAGRSFMQITSRPGEGPQAVGTQTIRDCEISDVCLQPGGGGSAISVNGNHGGKVQVLNTSIRLGCDRNLHADYHDNITGCFTSHTGDGANYLPNKHVEIRDCTFEVGRHYPGKGSARRPNVMVRDTELFELINTTIIQHPDAHEIALMLGDNIGTIRISADCRIEGRISYRGLKFDRLEDLLNVYPELRA